MDVPEEINMLHRRIAEQLNDIEVLTATVARYSKRDAAMVKTFSYAAASNREQKKKIQELTTELK